MPSVLVEDVLGRLDDGWSLEEVEGFIDALGLDDEHAAALWLLAWLEPLRPLTGDSRAARGRPG
jgi:hypothetical protein